MSDFKIGEQVYHLSNKKIIMVVVKINEAENEIFCRWLDAKGIKQLSEFMPEELGKYSNTGIKFS